MKRLKTYLQALQAGEYSENVISGTIQQLEACSLQELSENRLLVSSSILSITAILSVYL